MSISLDCRCFNKAAVIYPKVQSEFKLHSGYSLIQSNELGEFVKS